MKRAAWVAVVSFLVILLLFFFSDTVRRGAVQQMEEELAHLEDMALSGDTWNALGLLEKMEMNWQHRAAYLNFFTHHQPVERVGEAMQRVKAALETGEQYEMLLGLWELRDAVEEVYEQDAFLLKNLL